MADGQQDDTSSLLPKLIICLIAAASAAVVVTIYHCITTGHVRAILRLRSRSAAPPPHRAFVQRGADVGHQHSISMEHSLAELIPSHKYQKGAGLIPENDGGGMCAVCLSEFEEGDELRTLPECMHSYHAGCIDMWLFSHTNCPVCRTNAAPSPQILMHLLESHRETTPPAPARLSDLYMIYPALT